MFFKEAPSSKRKIEEKKKKMFYTYICSLIFLAKRTLLGSRKEFMAVLEALENKIQTLPDILLNLKNLSDIK